VLIIPLNDAPSDSTDGTSMQLYTTYRLPESPPSTLSPSPRANIKPYDTKMEQVTNSPSL